MLDTLKRRAVTQVLCYAHVAVERHVFWHVTEMCSSLQRLFKNVESRDRRAAGGWRHEACQNSHGGSFASTGGSQKSHDFAAANLEMPIPDAWLASIAVLQLFAFHHIE